MISNFLKNKVQAYLFNGQAYTPPATYYVALSKTAPNADGTGVTEPTGGAYARVGLDKGTTIFTTVVDGVAKNKARFEFPESTANWGTCTHYAIYDAKTGGNLLWYNQLSTPRTIEIEMQLFINAESLSFTLGN